MVGKFDPRSDKGRAAAYAVPPSQHADNTRYTVPPSEYVGGARYIVPNQTMSNNYGVQIYPMSKLTDKPIQCTCANCRSLIITQTKQTPGLLVWILCFVLILFGCWLGCCLIPCCIRDIQNIQHYCPNCKSFIGEYRPL